jgi:hypothetical protein
MDQLDIAQYNAEPSRKQRRRQHPSHRSSEKLLPILSPLIPLYSERITGGEPRHASWAERVGVA